MKNSKGQHRHPKLRWMIWLTGLLVLTLAGLALADVPTRVGVRGTVPNPGTQQQELANITFPAPYNVFEFLVTCAACHGGQVDQQVAHFGNWAGTSMASAARDPVYRANQIIINNAIKSATGKDGAGNMCMRCHSPNGWYSGRFDPTLNGAADGSSMLHSILLSTDDEGIPCEMCHRTMGATTFKRPDLDDADPAWNMMADIDDWPHSGMPYIDQEGDPTIAPGSPYGDTTLQIDEGMTYIGRYPGTADIYWSDTPLQGTYTGQTYGIYPQGWLDYLGNDISGKPATAADGSLLIQLDIPIGPPANPDGSPNYNAQSVSPEHSTVKYPNAPPGKGFIQTSEFCGTCHDLTVPVLNHGMPEQRTFTEWKYSAFGKEGPEHKTCQDCHMPRLTHEYADDIPGSFNADPFGEPGGWPYSKPRTNTAVHKLVGANRDLPMMMKALYPEADFEVVGGGEGAGGIWVGTGNDVRIFPGMLSNRNSMWDRNQRNTEVALHDGVDVQIVKGPALNAAGKWEVQVKVINNTGHRIPSGYPDGRRMWINLEVKDRSGAVVYESGHYDEASAALFTDGRKAGLSRALEPNIDSANNAVMLYERVTGTCNEMGCTSSLSLLNDFILFDNRIPPLGFDYSQYRVAGAKFWNYDPSTFVPYEDADRYADGKNFDLITYTFSAPAGVVPASARAEAYWQTHTREFMEHLRTSDTSTLRPQGPPRVWDPNYPLSPNYLSEEFGLEDVSAQIQQAGFISEPLRDNWGGIAYAAWYVTGKGAPYRMAVADTAATLPAPPGNLEVFPKCDPATGACSGGVTNPDTGLLEPYTQKITWSAVPDADGYLVWIKYGVGETTASWDRLAVVEAPATELINTALNVNKTYQYKVQAFNGAGFGPESTVVSAKTPWDLPLPAENLQFLNSTGTTITMSWMDAADNEDGWIVFRQTVPADPQAGFTRIATLPSTTLFGGVSFTDGNLNQPGVEWAANYVPPQPGKCYNYVVEAFNTAGNSGWNINGPVQMCTTGVPDAASALSATAVNGFRVDLAWTDNAGNEQGFRIERSTDGGATFAAVATVAADVVSYSDTTVAPTTAYVYRVIAFNTAGDSASSNQAPVTTPAAPPQAPSTLAATPSAPAPTPPTVSLKWNDNSNNETGFTIQRATDPGFTVGLTTFTTGANATTFTDTTVEPKMTYYYRVRAFNTVGFSAWSNTASAVTPGEIPEAPANLRAAGIGMTSVMLAWTDKSDNEAGFYIERSRDGQSWQRVGQTSANITIFTNSNLTRTTTYFYRVQAYNQDGSSAFSNVLQLRTR